MNQIDNGLFAVEEAMPCNPKDIRLGKYSLPSTLQRAEREEAAARILTFSKQLDQWVGVSWARLGEMMMEDYQAFQAHNDAKRHNWDEETRVSKALATYRLLGFLTLGIYFLFAKKPVAQLKELPRDKIVFSCIYIMGPQAIATGIRELEAQGMLKHVEEGEGDNAIDIFFPTPTLIQTIMRKQGLATA